MPHSLRPSSIGSLVALFGLGLGLPASAFEIATGNPDVKLRWDNTVKYSLGARVKSADAELTSTPNPNFDDGDRNFDKGVNSNRFDLLSEADLTYRNVGARVSAAAWYDSVYNSSTDNDSPFTYNAFSVDHRHYTNDTEKLHGRKAEILDAFIFAKGEVGDSSYSVRAGRHALLWGESLFFGENGIVAGQSSRDIIKLLAVPNSQVREFLRPIGQVSGQLQLNPAISIGAYVQYDWEPDRLPASGSYLSRADLLGRGGERLIVGPPIAPGGGPAAFFRTKDLEPSGSGQGGLQLRWRNDAIDTDIGFYAIRYHDKSPQFYLRPSGGADPASGSIGTYQQIYHQGVKAYGVSATKTFGSVNLAGEISVRRNTALVANGGAAVVLPGQAADGDHNPLYPVGNSVHAQVSAIHTLERAALWDGGFLLGEIAWHRRTSITKNAQNLDPNATRDAVGLRVLFIPTWYQVLPGLELSAPIGLGYNPSGRSSVITLFNGGWSKGGDLSIGLSSIYLDTWKASINYTTFIGSAGTILDPLTTSYTFKQSLKDRDFVTLSIQRTF